MKIKTLFVSIMVMCLAFCTTSMANNGEDFSAEIVGTSGLSAKEIIQKSDAKLRGVSSSRAEMTMTIVRPSWKREMKLKSWSKGQQFSLILVTAPARDKGVSFLKRSKEIWNWQPTIERTIKMPTSMMGQSWMGSDLKNDDLVDQTSIVDDFNHKLLGMETIEGRECYKIELIPHEDSAVVWGKIISWVDKKDFIDMKSEFYDEDDYLVQTMMASNAKKMGGKTIATTLTVIPADEEGHKTVMTYNSIEFDQPIKESFFSIQNMKRVR